MSERLTPEMEREIRERYSPGYGHGAVVHALLAELERVQKDLKTEKECRHANKHSVAVEAGGQVEGQPTSTLNYLQRIRELRRAEGENDALRTQLAEAQAKLRGYREYLVMRDHKLMAVRGASEAIEVPTPESLAGILDENLQAQASARESAHAAIQYVCEATGYSVSYWQQQWDAYKKRTS